MSQFIVKRIIKPNKWYIADLRRISKITQTPRLLKKELDNVYQAKKIISKYLDNSLRFEYIKGSKAIELGMTIMNLVPRIYTGRPIYWLKYDYADTDTTVRNKKTYRTRFRRHQRAKKGEYYKRKA